MDCKIKGKCKWVSYTHIKIKSFKEKIIYNNNNQGVIHTHTILQKNNRKVISVEEGKLISKLDSKKGAGLTDWSCTMVAVKVIII